MPRTKPQVRKPKYLPVQGYANKVYVGDDSVNVNFDALDAKILAAQLNLCALSKGKIWLYIQRNKDGRKGFAFAIQITPE